MSAATPAAAASQSVLDVTDFSVEFRTRAGIVRALDRVAFSVGRGETMALVGESGSGKSVTAYALLGLLDAAGRITGGSARLEGTELTSASPAALSAIRGKRAAMIFQNPRAALNPIRNVGKQIGDVLRRHAGLGARAAAAEAIEMLRAVGIPDPARRAGAYPFELSGGMCQRVMIAIAVATRPALLIADEPTTGLDVTTQAVVMDIMGRLAAETGMATILITHDLALAAERSGRIAVMHAGHIVEDAPTKTLLLYPRHPYTRRLLAATPTAAGNLADLRSIPGNLPDLRRDDLPPCRFAARCDRRLPACEAPMQWRELEPHHRVACWNPA
ncbi:oligopeptide/dipeptide ABC transporter ATP-binding protein [Humitalea rosea]|uniref:Oligopeptide/dipeptide ABC transporter ATP-binding protein n=1 Tax=Humitalea rosea TaxID=990373 RepID=A0A2W7IDY9_9PROT|nr:oligopeptide/dipeptide ABC transporter ATP-binding protein [Humitalea rosea]